MMGVSWAEKRIVERSMQDDRPQGVTGKGERLLKERRSGKERRKNSSDRRDSARFGTEERRSGEDRRKDANRWSKAPDTSSKR